MTTGSPARFDTPGARSNLPIRIARSTLAQTLSLDDATLEATVRTAVRDLRRVGRNLDLIDEEILADALSEEKRQNEQQSERA